MTLRSMALWLALLAFDASAQLSFKMGAGALTDQPMGLGWFVLALTTPWVLGALASYLGSFLTWLLILRQHDLSRAFPLSAVTYIVVLLASHLLLGEAVDLGRWAGAGIIMVGVAVMGGEA